jgi:hypothetical protein
LTSSEKILYARLQRAFPFGELIIGIFRRSDQLVTTVTERLSTLSEVADIIPTKEEWLKERERDRNLTPEERERELDEYIKQNKKRLEEKKKNEQNLKPQSSQNPFENYDHPNSLDNSEATIIWVVVMAVGTIFKGNWVNWIIATIIWLKYITRHKIKK